MMYAAATSGALLWGLIGCGPAPIETVSLSHRLTDKLIAHWDFDEKTGAIVTDRSGNGHDGQLTGGTWAPTEGRFGGGLKLQMGDSVTIPGFPQATPEWTVSGWIKLSAADKAAFTSDRAVLLTSERAQAGGWEIEFDPRDGFEWIEASYYVAPPTNDYVLEVCKCIETDRWIHWTAVFEWNNSNRRFTLYQNGVVRDQSLSVPAPIASGEPDLGIGRWYKEGRSLSGVIDDYAVWSRALSPEEVAAIDAQQVPAPL
jgi:hypothetical protein